MVRKQFGTEYWVEDRCFQLDTSRGDPSISLEYERMTPQQWTLTKEGTYRQVCVHVKQDGYFNVVNLVAFM